ncbi:nucleoside tri-diphosphate phosphatase [Leptotrichia hongkongensis]|uniref:nucleoside tri-diphosphate phosphatase n=1 Tax=Leptotrichia hongkongensis TaxID=554406 RepID=UPI0035A8AFE5
MIEICYTTNDLKNTKSYLLNRYRKLDIVVHNPREGEFITVKSYKHDGSLHRTWRDSMILKTSDQAIIACNDHTLVTESDGRRWLTREPALLYYHKHYWFNIVTMIRQKGISYYCNLASPYVLDAEALKYIDYDLDIKIFPDGEKRLLDVDEYELHRRQMHYSKEIDQILKANVEILVDWINNKKGPFSPEYVDLWYERYIQLTYRKS